MICETILFDPATLETYTARRLHVALDRTRQRLFILPTPELEANPGPDSDDDKEVFNSLLLALERFPGVRIAMVGRGWWERNWPFTHWLLLSIGCDVAALPELVEGGGLLSLN